MNKCMHHQQHLHNKVICVQGSISTLELKCHPGNYEQQILWSHKSYTACLKVNTAVSDFPHAKHIALVNSDLLFFSITPWLSVTVNCNRGVQYWMNVNYQKSVFSNFWHNGSVVKPEYCIRRYLTTPRKSFHWMCCIDAAADKLSKQVGWLNAWSLDLPLQPPTHYLGLPLFYFIHYQTLYNASALH